MATTKKKAVDTTKKKPSKKKSLKISKKKSLRRSAIYDAVNEKLIEAGWEEGSLKRSHAKDMVNAIATVLIENAVADKGVALPGIGKITFKHRSAKKGGEKVTRFGKEMTTKKRAAAWVPRMKLSKAAKVALLENAPKA